MEINSLGIPHFTDDDAVLLLYQNKMNICHEIIFHDSEDVKKFNTYCKNFNISSLAIKQDSKNISKAKLDSTCQTCIFMPEKYYHIEIENFLLEKCSTDVEKNRVILELNDYKKYNLIYLLRYMIFLVDTMREHKILWGVGRGSSVSSFVLFLIGIHRINSLTYNLNWKDFLR